MSGKIEKEIDEMANKLEKANMTPEERVLETIKEIGSDGLKKKMDDLSDDNKALLKSILEKAVSFDDEYQANYVQGNINDTKIQEDKADDDEDEDLVKLEAAAHNHQGDQSPEGRDGHVIKSIEKSYGKMKKMVKMCMDRGMSKGDMVKMCMDKGMYKGDKDKVKEMIDSAMAEHNKNMHGGEVKKAMSVEEAAKKVMTDKYGVDDVIKELGEEKRDDLLAKLREMKNGKKDMKKADSLIQTRKAGETDMTGVEKKDKINEEEDQISDTSKITEGKSRAKDEDVDELEVGEDNKAAQTKVNDVNQGGLKKSVAWEDDNALLKAGRGGQNYHFNVNNYYDNVIKSKDESKPEGEPLEKSEKEYDLNDLIEKGLTKSWLDVEKEIQDKEAKEKENGSLVKSFSDEDILKSLGYDEDVIKKALKSSDKESK